MSVSDGLSVGPLDAGTREDPSTQLQYAIDGGFGMMFS